jgi:threonine dehydrogenase-like Zn-dependent dehydrogenase
MKALVYQGPGRTSRQERPTPQLQSPGDAIVNIAKTTICGTDLHILKGDVPTCAPGRILGHEGTGTVQTVGSGAPASFITRLVDTVSTPTLPKTIVARKIDPVRLITHRFTLDRIRDAYETFAHAASTQALTVIIEA